MQSRRRRAGEVNLSDFLILMLVLVSAIAGVTWGIELGTVHGFWGKMIGGVLGLIAGAVGAVLIAQAIAVASEPFDYFWRWWRPDPPVCENGACVSRHDYRRSEIHEDVVRSIRGLASFGMAHNLGVIMRGLFGIGTARALQAADDLAENLYSTLIAILRLLESPTVLTGSKLAPYPIPTRPAPIARLGRPRPTKPTCSTGCWARLRDAER